MNTAPLSLWHNARIATCDAQMRVIENGALAVRSGRIAWLGAAGEAGVAKAIDILEKELSVAMALTGTNRIADIGLHVLVDGGTKKTAARKKD